jgi:hypothetical protein
MHSMHWCPLTGNFLRCCLCCSMNSGFSCDSDALLLHPHSLQNFCENSTKTTK